MRIFNRGATVAFSHSFYDSSGDVTSPSSATLTLSYPSSGFPFRGCMESTSVALTENSTTLAWEGEWASRVGYPGTVYWHIEADDLTLAVEDGHFRLRGNPANLSIASTV